MENQIEIKAPLTDEEKARLESIRQLAATGVISDEAQAEMNALAERESVGTGNLTEGQPPADAPAATAPSESIEAPATPVGDNSGTQPPNFDGTPQTPQPSSPEPNFNPTVDAHVEDQTKVEPGANGELPGGVTQTEGDGELILMVSSGEEFGRYDFDGKTNAAAGEKVVVDDKASGAASVTVHVTGEADGGFKLGYLTARIIGDGASRVYIFRKNEANVDGGSVTTFTAKFTSHP